MSIPGQVLFIFAADYIHSITQADQTNFGPVFIFSYLSAALLQVSCLIHLNNEVLKNNNGIKTRTISLWS